MKRRKEKKSTARTKEGKCEYENVLDDNSI